jgi:hypothetical protein
MVVLLDPGDDHDDVLRVNRSRERKYMFDVVSDARADQQEVYAATAKILLNSVLEGYNATVFAYGATGEQIRLFNEFRCRISRSYFCFKAPVKPTQC